jgi:hypothetical protein
MLGGLITFSAASGLGSLAGLVVLSTGIFVTYQTSFAKIMYGQTPGMRLLCRTVLIIGTAIAFITIIGIFFSWSNTRL